MFRQNSNLNSRVRYSHTDHSGVVYYARYLDWMEAGRTEFLRHNGISYSEMENKGFFAPVARVEVDYRSSARYDDIITVQTSIEKIGNTSISFVYKFTKEDKLLAEAKTVNVFITKNGKPVRVPDEIRAVLK